MNISYKSFSIIIPSFNSEEYITSCLSSLVNLNYPKDKIEVLVIDDGSTDNTSIIVEKFIKENSFIKYYKKENNHWGSVINYAVQNKLINNDLVSVLDSDDQLLPEGLNLINGIARNSDMIASAFYKWDGTKKTKKVSPYWFIFKKQLTNKLQMNTPFCLPLNFFTKKEVFYRLNKLNENMAYQDPDYLSQLINNSRSMVITRKAVGLYYFNRLGNSISQAWDKSRFNAEFMACENVIRNNAQEIVVYRLCQKKFRKLMKENSEKKFIVNRRFSFKWFPFYLRFFFFLFYYFALKKYFVFK